MPVLRPSIISGITDWPRDLASYGILLVVSAVDEAPSASCAFGAFRPLAPEKAPTAGVVGCCVLLAFAPKTEEHRCDQEAGHRRPFEAESIFTNVCAHPSGAEFVASKNVGRRHECGSQRLEEQSEGGQQTAQIAAQTRAKSQHAGEQGADGKEQGDQLEGEHEARQEEVLAGADEGLRYTDRGAKVATRGRVEREGRMHGTAVVLAIHDGAQIPEGPSMLAFEPWDACGVDLEEIELVDGAVIRGACEDDEEHHGEGARDENEGEQGEE